MVRGRDGWMDGWSFLWIDGWMHRYVEEEICFKYWLTGLWRPKDPMNFCLQTREPRKLVI